MMPMDEKTFLLLLSQKELKVATILAKSEEPPAEAIGFHLQQAAEKALKAWLLFIGSDYPKTHDLSHLLVELDECKQPIEFYWDLVELNPFAVQFRYGIFDDEQYEWADSYRLTKMLIDYVVSLASKE